MVANVTCSRTSHIQTAQYGFGLLKGPDLINLPCVKIWWKLSSNWDMIQNVILQGCDLERLR